jgi:hypothetical protein
MMDLLAKHAFLNTSACSDVLLAAQSSEGTQMKPLEKKLLLAVSMMESASAATCALLKTSGHQICSLNTLFFIHLHLLMCCRQLKAVKVPM